MQRYILFGGQSYYACGGLHDYQGGFNTKAAAVSWAESDEDFEWWHVLDRETMLCVAESPYQGYGADGKSAINWND